MLTSGPARRNLHGNSKHDRPSDGRCHAALAGSALVPAAMFLAISASNLIEMVGYVLNVGGLKLVD